MSQVTEQTVYRSAASRVVAGEPEVAVEELTEALRINPDAGRLWELRGQAHLALGERLDAVNCLEHASCLIPLSGEGQLALAHAYELTEKRELATEVFSALAVRKDLPLEVLEPLARALGRNSKPHLALRVCAEAAKRQPDSPMPLLGMVFYQRRLGWAPDRILPVLFRAFHLDPENFDIRMTLARMLHETGQYREAAQLLSVVEIEQTRCPKCLAAMKLVFEEVGDQENIDRCVQTLVAIATEDSP